MFICRICKEEKEKSEFTKKKTNKTGYRKTCKVCDKKKLYEWRKNNKEKLRDIGKRYYDKNKEKIKSTQKKWREENKEKIDEYQAKWRDENRERTRANSLRYQKENKEKVNEYRRKWNEKNKDKTRTYQENNREKINIWQRSYTKQEHVKFRKRANAKLNYHVKRGNIFKPELCSICGEKKRVESHHHDYEKPLDVIWVCRKCHVSIHHNLGG